MGWFRKDRPADIWDRPEARPEGDIEAARRIRAICDSAAASARKIANFAHIDPDEAARYQAARRHAISLARNIRDELLHDAAMRDILGLCMKANDVETAAALASEIRAEPIRKAVMRDHPYFISNAAPTPATRR